MQNIIILGGGTAGWMTALMLQRLLVRETRITLIESQDIGTIGVGEGTTPWIRNFFRQVGIEEHEWMPRCQATYKCGIRFPGWSTHPGYQSYYHPFFSPLDKEVGDAFFNNANLRRRGWDVPANPADFFVTAYLSEAGLSPFTDAPLPFELDYAYHFDAGLLGQFLRETAIARGVVHQIDTVDDVVCHPNGAIRALVCREHGLQSADYFVDCTGFAGVLIGKSLGVSFNSFSDNLLNNAAVTLQTPLTDADKVTETRSQALDNGWMWKIPLAQRVGNGYVYSDDFISAEQAEQTLRQTLGVSEDVQARHLKMRVGRRSEHWKHNCLAVGLSQGFIEPLEATALMLVQYTIEQFIQGLNSPEGSNPDLAGINQRINNMFDGVRDYVVAHYKTNSRSDSDYWITNREATPVSGRLASILTTWRQGDELEPVLTRLDAELVYARPSWYCLLAGMGQFPTQLKADNASQGVNLAPVQHYCQQTRAHFLSQTERLQRLAKGVKAHED